MYYGRVSIPSTCGDYVNDLGIGSAGARLMENVVGRENLPTFVVLHNAWISLLGDSDHEVKPPKIITKFSNRFLRDPLGVIASLSDLAHELRKSIVWEDGETSISHYLKEFEKTPIFREYLLFFNTHDPKTLRYVLTFLEFGKKVTYKDLDLDSTAFRGWINVEMRLSQLKLPDVTRQLKPIIQFFLKEWDFTSMFPKHGSGAVAQKHVIGTEAKNREFTVTDVQNYMYFRDHNIFDSSDIPLRAPDGMNPKVSNRMAARLFFVPKTYKTSRTICMEPISYMWLQQSVRYYLEKAIEEGPLRRHVVLDDQRVNQRDALIGALCTDRDTIDLSSASDSVSWELVKTTFPPEVLKHLQATRSSTVTIADVIDFDVNKFAPMGSAVCFPIQSIIFSSVVAYVGICQTYGQDVLSSNLITPGNVETLFKTSFPQRPVAIRNDLVPFRVYGDDIITDSRLTQNVILVLNALGFSVNEEKSFTGLSGFRESCGKEYAWGFDVSPFKLKIKSIDPNGLTMDVLGGLIDQINLLHDFGYACARRHLISVVLYYPIEGIREPKTKNPILFSSDRDESFSIVCDTPNNRHLLTRSPDDPYRSRVVKMTRSDFSVYEVSLAMPSYTNIHLQRSEVRSITSGPIKKRKHSIRFDYGAYLHRDRALLEAHGESEDTFITRVDTMENGVRWRWTATG